MVIEAISSESILTTVSIHSRNNASSMIDRDLNAELLL
jgi:hypothetical protein